MRVIGLALVLAIAACGKGSGDEKVSNPPADGSADLPPATQTVSVGLLGVGASGSVLVRVASLELTVDGHVLPVQVKGEELDLNHNQNAWMVTTFDLPADAAKVAINLKFQPEGSVERNGKTRVLDLSGPPLSLVADAVQMRTRSHAVLEIDLARSLIDQGEQVLLLPAFVVRY